MTASEITEKQSATAQNSIISINNYETSESYEKVRTDEISKDSQPLKTDEQSEIKYIRKNVKKVEIDDFEPNETISEEKNFDLGNDLVVDERFQSET